MSPVAIASAISPRHRSPYARSAVRTCSATATGTWPYLRMLALVNGPRLMIASASTARRAASCT